MMNQKRYLTKVLEMSRSTPSEQKLECDQRFWDPRRYNEAVSCLIYAMTCTRPVYTG